VRKENRSKSQKITTEDMQKMSSLEKIFVEGIRKNSEFEDIINDPRLLNICGNFEI